MWARTTRTSAWVRTVGRRRGFFARSHRRRVGAALVDPALSVPVVAAQHGLDEGQGAFPLFLPKVLLPDPVQGLPVALQDGVDGFLYDVGDVPAMADGCISILSNPKLRDGLGKAAREHATRDFCASKIVLQYEDLYARTIKEVQSGR